MHYTASEIRASALRRFRAVRVGRNIIVSALGGNKIQLHYELESSEICQREMSVQLTAEQVAFLLPLLQRMVPSEAPTIAAPTAATPPQEHHGIADMFRKKRKGTKSTPAQNFLHVSSCCCYEYYI